MTLTTIIAVLVTTIVFLGLDAIWLKAVIGPFFRERIGHLMLEDPKLGVAAGFYIFYAIGIVYFAVMPGLAAGDIRLALFNGAFLGLIGYGTYEFTSMAIMKEWQWSMLTLDVGWGIFVSAAAAAAGFYAASAVSG